MSIPEIKIPDWPTWRPDIHATLMFVHQGNRVLLIEKLTGIGQGKINGPGGKIDPGETPEQCVIRESQEELSLKKYQKINENDVLAICDTGAYGIVLASNYNLRTKPAEIMINKSNFKVISKRENINKIA